VQTQVLKTVVHHENMTRKVLFREPGGGDSVTTHDQRNLRQRLSKQSRLVSPLVDVEQPIGSKACGFLTWKSVSGSTQNDRPTRTEKGPRDVDRHRGLARSPNAKIAHGDDWVLRSVGPLQAEAVDRKVAEPSGAIEARERRQKVGRGPLTSPHGLPCVAHGCPSLAGHRSGPNAEGHWYNSPMPLSKGDLDRLLDLLSTPDRRVEALDAADRTLRDAYWQDKNLGMVAWLGSTVMPLSHNETDPEILSKIKTIAYNVASFLWPGWDEEGLEITPDQRELGRQAADLNLRLAHDLDKPAIAVSRAHWMRGGYFLTDRDFPAAAQSYTEAARLAKEAENHAEVLLSEAFLALAMHGPELKSKLAELRTQKDGEAYAGQVIAAARVCGISAGLE